MLSGTSIYGKIVYIWEKANVKYAVLIKLQLALMNVLWSSTVAAETEEK